MIDLQKAPPSKRMFAFFADLIIAAMLTVGIYLLMSAVVDTDTYSARYNEIRADYEEEYGVKFGVTAEQYAEMSEAEQKHYSDAVDAMNGDKEANEAITTYYVLSLVIFSSGIFVSVMILEFIIPAAVKDGRSLGKLLFGLGVMRTGFIRAKAPVIFVRNVIGKGVMEVILPAMTVISIYLGITGVFGWILIAVFIAAEAFVLVKSGSNRFLHDVIADTVAVEWNSQMIFDSERQRDEYVEEQKAKEKEKIY